MQLNSEEKYLDREKHHQEDFLWHTPLRYLLNRLQASRRASLTQLMCWKSFRIA